MARTAIPNYTTGQKIDAGHANTYWKDNEAAHWAILSKLYPLPAARVSNVADQSIPNNIETALSFDTDRYDYDDIHSTASNKTRLVAKTAGIYLIGGYVLWQSSSTGVRALTIKLNGTTDIAIDRKNAVATAEHCISTQYELAVNDYVELYVYQSSGGALDAKTTGHGTEFMMSWLGYGVI